METGLLRASVANMIVLLAGNAAADVFFCGYMKSTACDVLDPFTNTRVFENFGTQNELLFSPAYSA
jgi:hypothetical protein